MLGAIGWDEIDAYGTPEGVAVEPEPGIIASGDLATALPQIVGAVAQWDYLRQLNEINLLRAERGLEPLTQAQMPGVQAQVGLSPGTQTFLLASLAAVLVFFLLKKR